jgi:hypothetical protein
LPGGLLSLPYLGRKDIRNFLPTRNSNTTA